MQLPHHPDIVDKLRRPSADDPWRILISGCLFGWPVGTDGTDYGLGEERPAWLDSPQVKLVPFCPEDDALGTPRHMPDLHGGDGFAVLDGTARILDEHREDLTDRLLKSANTMLELAMSHDIDFAVLTDRSGLCGSQVISIGCRFEEPIQHQKGVGLATALLLREGFHIVSQRDFLTLHKLRAIVELGHSVDDKLRDHHEHPWVLENLG